MDTNKAKPVSMVSVLDWRKVLKCPTWCITLNGLTLLRILKRKEQDVLVVLEKSCREIACNENSSGYELGVWKRTEKPLQMCFFLDIRRWRLF